MFTGLSPSEVFLILVGHSQYPLYTLAVRPERNKTSPFFCYLPSFQGIKTYLRTDIYLVESSQKILPGTSRKNKNVLRETEKQTIIFAN